MGDRPLELVQMPCKVGLLLHHVCSSALQQFQLHWHEGPGLVGGNFPQNKVRDLGSWGEWREKGRLGIKQEGPSNWSLRRDIRKRIFRKN